MYEHKVYIVFNVFVLMPAIEPVSIDRFPDCVRDMLQNKESKLKGSVFNIQGYQHTQYAY